jgi:hypothetical protein
MEIYVQKNNQQLGPFPESKIKDGLDAGEFQATDLVWYEGLSEWISIARMGETKLPPTPPPASQNPLPEIKRAFCTKCGTERKGSMEFCTSCGAKLDGTTSPLPIGAVPTVQSDGRTNLIYPRTPPLSPHLCWLNWMLPGLAQLIYGQIAKGITIFVCYVALFGFLSVRFGDGEEMSPLILVIFVAFSAASIFDAYRVGKTLAEGLAVEKWVWFPTRKEAAV